MRLLRGGLRVIVVGAVTVAVGVAINQVLNGGQFNLWWLLAAVALAALAAALDLWLGTRGKNSSQHDSPRPTLWPSLKGNDERPLPLHEVTPSDLGVHPSRFGAEGDSPYVHRKADDLLALALADDRKRLIIVEGPRLAGATSTLAQAAQDLLPDHLAAGFIDDPRVPLADMITQAGQWTSNTASDSSGVVLWLDSLGPDRFAELARIPLGNLPPAMWVLATLADGELEGLRIPEQLDKLLDQHAARIRLTSINEQERRDLRAQEVYAPLRPVLDQEDLFLGRIMVAWKPLRAALTRGGSEQATDRVALLRAATDWYRVHLPRLLSADVLEYLYRAYRAEMTGAIPGSPVSATGLRDALQWATAAATADHPRLLDLQYVPGGQRYAPHPLLTVIADDPDDEASWSVAESLWSYADRYFEGDQRRDIGYSALTLGAAQAAARLLNHADSTIDPGAYNRLALLFYERGELASSREWWRRAANTSDAEQAPKAMFNLAVLEHECGDLKQTRHWLLEAISTGHTDLAPKSMLNLGGLEQEQGDLDQARHWLLEAISTGHTDAAPRAMGALSGLEKEQANFDAARHWLLEAINTSHTEAAPRAMIDLGVLEQGQGNLGQARDWYQQAVDSGHTDQAPRAMNNLGALEEEEDDLGQARHWYQQAVDSGHTDQAPKAMNDLGVLEQGQRNLGQARDWYQQAVESGHTEAVPQAMKNLGVLEHGLGDFDQARHWYHQAVDSGHTEAAPKAMLNMANLEMEQGNLDQARHWFLESIHTGHTGQAPKAMVNLGIVEKLRGNLGQARHWFHRAVDTGHAEAAPKAIFNLGSFEQDQGNLGQARHWYEGAVRTGHPDVVVRAQQNLQALARHENERLRGEHFGRYGYLAYADPDLMRRGKENTETPNTGLTDHESGSDHGDSPIL